MTRAFLIIALTVSTACANQPVVQDDSTVSQLCIVRHAEAYKNLDPQPVGFTAEQLDALTPEGMAQARHIRDALPDGIAQVWSSPTQRTRQTAEVLRGAVPVVVEPRLRSLDGKMSWDERVGFWSRGEDPRPETGESLADGDERAEALLGEIRATLPSGRHAVVVTHGDIASLLLGGSRGTPILQRPNQDTVNTGEVICVPLQLRSGNYVQ